ncbi:unnamed protein product [Choristocarpus tenellus]
MLSALATSRVNFLRRVHATAASRSRLSQKLYRESLSNPVKYSLSIVALGTAKCEGHTLPKNVITIPHHAIGCWDLIPTRIQRINFQVLRKVLRALRSMLRVLFLLALWTPVCVGGAPILLLQRFDLLPECLRELWWDACVRVVELSGPAFVKGIQWASTRRDMFPESFCDRFGRLQVSVRPRVWRHPDVFLDNAFGPTWREYLKLDVEKPIGSGCVAQVYKGKMLQGLDAGCLVAIKVVHPMVKSGIRLDINLMRAVADMLELLPRLRWLSLRENVHEFSELMENQLDLRLEAENLMEFRRNFIGHPEVGFPRPLYPWVSEHALVETLEEGKLVSSFFDHQEGYALARIGLQSFLKMVFLDNFVHADLHPGNILITSRADGKGSRLVFLDAGIVCKLGDADRRNFVDLFYAVVLGDGKRAGRLMIERARDQKCRDVEGFCTGIDELVQAARANSLCLRQIQVAEIIGKVLQLCLHHQVKLESHFMAVILAIGILEGVGRSLDQDCDILHASLPVVAQAQLQLALRKGYGIEVNRTLEHRN